MSKGRKPKPTQLKKLQGTYRKDRGVENEMQFTPMKSIPDAPARMPNEAHEIWFTCCSSLQALGMLFIPDLFTIERYVFAIYMSELAESHLWGGKVIESQVNKTGGKYKTKSQWWGIWKDSVDIMNKLGAKFGFSPSDRTKIAVPQTRQADPFDEFL